MAAIERRALLVRLVHQRRAPRRDARPCGPGPQLGQIFTEEKPGGAAVGDDQHAEPVNGRRGGLGQDLLEFSL